MPATRTKTQATAHLENRKVLNALFTCYLPSLAAHSRHFHLLEFWDVRNGLSRREFRRAK